MSTEETPKARRRPAPAPEAVAPMAPAAEIETAPAAAPEQTPKPEKAPKVLPSLEECLDAARAAAPDRYRLVQRVVAQTKDGTPARIEIRCSEPQTKQGLDGGRESVCVGLREIAVQDLFQVRCCAPCADRLVRIARRDRAKRKDKALRAAARAAKA